MNRFQLGLASGLLTTFLTVGFTSNPSWGQTVVQSNSTPGYVCPKCGRWHATNAYRAPAQSFSTNINSSQVNRVAYQTPGTTAPSITTRASYTAGRSQNVLAVLNAQRSRQGLRPLMADPQLQAVAQRRAQMMASTGQKGHPPGSFAPGRYEGVGWSSSYSNSAVYACYTSDPNMTYAGAAMATGRDGVYFAVVYR